MRLKGCKILNDAFALESKDIYIRDGKVSFSGDDSNVLDVSGLTVIPGLIDIHMHGFFGINLNYAKAKEIEKISEILLKNGVTGFLATLSSCTETELKTAVTNVSDAMDLCCTGGSLLGIYLEGPYIAISKKGGIHPKGIRTFSASEVDNLLKIAGNKIKIMTIAPESEENMQGIRYVSEKGICASVGHTDASAETIEMAEKAGASNATHLFNAMRGLMHREPGTVGGVLDSNMTAELICDGVHIHPKVIRAMLKTLGTDRLIFISDSVTCAGLPDGEYTYDDKNLIKKDGKITLKDGTISGNANPLSECIRRCVTQFGIPLADAVKCATINPAKRIGVADRKGSIAEGKDADLVVVDDAFNIKYVFKNGVLIQ